MVMREVDQDLAIFLGRRHGEKQRNIGNALVEDCDELNVSRGAGGVGDDHQLDGRSAVTRQDVSQGMDSANCNAPQLVTSAGSNGRSVSAGVPTGRLKPSCGSVPNARTVSPSSKVVAAQARLVSPSSWTSQASRPVMQTGLKSATGTCKPAATPSTTPSDRRKTGSRNSLLSRGTLAMANSKPSDKLSLSYDAPQNSKTVTPMRPASASRVKPSQSTSAKPRQKSCSRPKLRTPHQNGGKTVPRSRGHGNGEGSAKPRQKLCSPAKLRAHPCMPPHQNGEKTVSRSRGHGNGEGDDVNPVLMGTKMVERVVNMRKLAPPQQHSSNSWNHPRKPSRDSVGFGRSLSNKSLEMAIRHMDIRRSAPHSFHLVGTSAAGIRTSSSKKIGPGSVLESAHTSSPSDTSISSHSPTKSRLDAGRP